MEKRIREVAEKMDRDGVKGFRGEVPHSVFVEWDRTWDVADDLENDGYPCNPESTDEQIQAAIEHQEFTHGDYYYDEYLAYTNGGK
jgi:hypothetical protein